MSFFQFTSGFNALSGAALIVFDADVISPVVALFASTDPVGDRWALSLHLQVILAEVVAVQAPVQVVPQLGEVLFSARHALRGSRGGAVRGHVCARWTHGTGEDLTGYRIRVLVAGDGNHRQGAVEEVQEQEQHR